MVMIQSMQRLSALLSAPACELSVCVVLRAVCVLCVRASRPSVAPPVLLLLLLLLLVLLMFQVLFYK
jgi:hypothetical protein